MKKGFLCFAVCIVLYGVTGTPTVANDTTIPEPVVKIEIPASEVNNIDVRYKNEGSSVADKTTSTTKKAADKTVEVTKKATDKTVEVTKKTVNATKTATKKTVDGTKDLIDSLNPNKPVTLESLQAEAEIKTLKNEKNGLKSAYNSRINDIKAKIRATEKSTTLSVVEKQERIYALNKQKAELTMQRDNAITSYNLKIEEKKDQARLSR